MGGKMSAEYYREYRRRNHARIRARERVRVRERRRQMTPEERRKDRGQTSHARPSDITAIPPLHQGHELFDRARAIHTAVPGFRDFTHPYYDDAISEIVLAILERRDPVKAKTDLLRAEYAWKKRMVQEAKWSIE